MSHQPAMGGIEKVAFSPPKSRVREVFGRSARQIPPSPAKKNATDFATVSIGQHRRIMEDAPPEPISQPRRATSLGPTLAEQKWNADYEKKTQTSSRPKNATKFPQALPTLFFREEAVQSIEGKNDRIEGRTRKIRQV